MKEWTVIWLPPIDGGDLKEVCESNSHPRPQGPRATET